MLPKKRRPGRPLSRASLAGCRGGAGYRLRRLLAVVVIPLWWYLAGRFRGPVRVTQFISLPGHKDRPRFSPDGKQVAFEWDGEDGNNRDIYVKRSESDRTVQA